MSLEDEMSKFRKIKLFQREKHLFTGKLTFINVVKILYSFFPLSI